MELSTILLVIVSILMLLTGLSVLNGSSKKERPHSFWFFLAMLGGTVWSLSSGMYNAQMNTTEINVLWWLSYAICFGSLLASIGLLGYSLPQTKTGKSITGVLSVLAIVLMAVPFFNENLLSNLTQGEVSWFYIGYLCLIMINFGLTLVQNVIDVIKSKTEKARKSNMLFLLGLLGTLTISLIFNMIYPFLLKNFHLMWLGPLSIYILVLAFYLMLFSGHQIILKSGWFKILSYVILMASFAVLYMVLFFLIFRALFRDATPSTAVIMLNFVMVLVVLLLMPVIIEIMTFIKSLIAMDQMDIGYVLKKLNKVNSQNADIQEIADFLASHLHFAYIGIMVNGRLYESEGHSISADALKTVAKLKPSKHSIWHNLSNTNGQILRKQKVSAAADMYNDHDEVFGQILIGRPITDRRFSRRDLIQLESIVNMVATVVAPKKSSRK